MQIEYLREFIELARSLSFTKSSSELHVAQSTLSKHVSALEKEFGVSLFERNFNSVKLTRAGSILLEKLPGMIDYFDQMLDDIQNEAAIPKELLLIDGNERIPIIDTLMENSALYLMQKSNTTEARRYKTGQTLEEDFTRDIGALLKTRKIDVGIIQTYSDMSVVKEREGVHLFDEPLCFLAAKNNPLASKKHLRFTDLSNQQFALFSYYPEFPDCVIHVCLQNGMNAPPKETRKIVIENSDFYRHISSLEPNEVLCLSKSVVDKHQFYDNPLFDIVILDFIDANPKTEVWALYEATNKPAAIEEYLAALKAVVKLRNH